MRAIILIAMCCIIPSLVSTEDTIDASKVGRFERASLAFEDGDWPTAITIYNALLSDGVHTWALNFNLGNSYFKNNEPGPALFHLERALILAPNKPEIQELIQTVREAFNVPEYPLQNWEKWARWQSPNFWILAASVSGWVAILTLLLPQIRKLPMFDSTSFHFARILSVIALITALAAFAISERWYQEGIVTADEVVLKLAPTENSPEIRAFIPGEKARIFKESREHMFVETADGSSGWVPAASVAPLWR